MAFTSQPGVAQPGLFHPGNLESDTAAVTGADTFGTTVETASIAATLNGTDTASGAEAYTLVVHVNDSDTASGVDSESIAATVSDSDAGDSEEDENAQEDVHQDSDAGDSEEGESLIASLSSDDSIHSVESYSIISTLNGSDTASGADAQAVGINGSDAGSGVDGGEDTEEVHIGEDQITVTESYSIAVTLSSTDDLHAVDTHRPFPAGPVDIGDYQVSLVMGPATVYVADFETTEPLDSEISSVPAGDWMDIGSTLDGVVLTVKHEFESPDVMQKYDKAASRLKRRHVTVDMSMAEPTLINMLYALNSGELTAGSGYTSYSPPFLDRATPLTYRAVIIDGWAPGFSEITGQHRRRRIILRKCLSTEDSSLSYTKDKLTAQNVTWTVHRVDGVVPPLKVIDEE
jgi:hypothetical protein